MSEIESYFENYFNTILKLCDQCIKLENKELMEKLFKK